MNALSQPQQQIVALVQKGITSVSEIARQLGKDDGIVRAQLTRIRTAGHGDSIAKVQTGASPQASGKPTNITGKSSNQNVIQEAVDAGQANYELPDELIDAARQYTQESDVHPMVLLGVTIQFVKLVGGRLSAHQLIEQVYDALRAMVSDGSPKVGKEDWTAPWPLNAVETENQELKARLAELEKQICGQERRSVAAFTAGPATGVNCG